MSLPNSTTDRKQPKTAADLHLIQLPLQRLDELSSYSVGFHTRQLISQALQFIWHNCERHSLLGSIGVTTLHTALEVLGISTKLQCCVLHTANCGFSLRAL
eukprot:6457953-Amphidinium_carterae.1